MPREITEMEGWVDMEVRLRIFPFYYKKKLEQLYKDGKVKKEEDFAVVKELMRVLDGFGVPFYGGDFEMIKGQWPEAEVQFSEMLEPSARLKYLTPEQRKQLEDVMGDCNPENNTVWDNILRALEVARQLDQWGIPHHEFPPPKSDMDWMMQEMKTYRPYYSVPYHEMITKQWQKGLSTQQQIDCLFPHEKEILAPELIAYIEANTPEKRWNCEKALERAMKVLGVPSTVSELNSRNAFKDRILAVIEKE
jgi:hypothetical protein